MEMVVILGLFLAVADGRAAESEEFPTIQHIQAVLAVNHDQIQSLNISYRVTSRSTFDNPDSLQHEHMLVVDGRNRRRENIHWSRRLPSSCDLNHNIQFYEPDLLGVYYKNLGIVEISRGHARSQSSWKARFDPVLALIGWWPRDDERPPPEPASNSHLHLRYALSASTSRVIGFDVAPPSRRCVKICNGLADVLWLDPDCGYAIRMRELYDELTGKIAFRQLSTQFQECRFSGANGAATMWYPRSILVDDWRGENRLRNPLKLEYTVLSFALNSKATLSAEFAVPPGSLIVDRDTGITTEIAGGRELLDTSVQIVTEFQRVRHGGDGWQTCVRWLELMCWFFGSSVALCVWLTWRTLRLTDGVAAVAAKCRRSESRVGRAALLLKPIAESQRPEA